MRLMNINTGDEIASILESDEILKIKEPGLKKDIDEKGIFIPKDMLEEFDYHGFISSRDEKFLDAFKDVYWRIYMDHIIYRWVE